MAKPVIVFSIQDMRERLHSLEKTVQWAEDEGRRKNKSQAIKVWTKHRHTVEQMREYLEAYDQLKG